LIRALVTDARIAKPPGTCSALSFRPWVQHDPCGDVHCYKVMLLDGSKNPATLDFYRNCGFVQDNDRLPDPPAINASTCVPIIGASPLTI